eukprot:g10917.t1
MWTLARALPFVLVVAEANHCLNFDQLVVPQSFPKLLQVHPGRQLQTGAWAGPDAACLQTCSGLQTALQNVGQQMQNVNTQDPAAMMKSILQSMCTYKADFACLANTCPPPAGDTWYCLSLDENPMSQLVPILSCLCDACPSFIDVMTGMMTTIGQLMSGNYNETETWL